MHVESGLSARWRPAYPAIGKVAMPSSPPSPGPSNARLTLAAVLAALPCGYCFGVVAAFLLAGGPDIGHRPLFTVPLALLVAITVALLPFLRAQTRFMITIVGAIASAVLFLMVRTAFP